MLIPSSIVRSSFKDSTKKDSVLMWWCTEESTSIQFNQMNETIFKKNLKGKILPLESANTGSKEKK